MTVRSRAASAFSLANGACSRSRNAVASRGINCWVFSPMELSASDRYGVRKSGWLARSPVKTPPEATPMNTGRSRSIPTFPAGVDIIVRHAQDLIDPRFEDRGNSVVVHGRPDDDHIGRFDFPNKGFGNIRRTLRWGCQRGRRRQRCGIVGHGVEQGFEPQVTPANARPGRNLERLFDDRGRKRTAM